MKCPVDNATLMMTERTGVEIDYCPECRGVWLDRGELDKIVQGASQERNEYTSPDNHQHDRERDTQRHDSHDKDYDSKKKNKRGSFIGDIFGGFGED
jgi:Zn-finger nucleic acid-binding protein